MTTFTWGLNKGGQLGVGHRQSSNIPCSVRLPGHGKAIQASSGGHFTCVLTDRGQVFAFGSGKHGRLGLGSDSEEDRLKPAGVAFPGPVQSVACGSWHGCAVGSNGELYAWGYGRALGSVGKGNINGTPSPVPLFSSLPVRAVSCGHNFTLVCTQAGGVYSWGAGRHGVLGHGDETDKAEPTALESAVLQYR